MGRKNRRSQARRSQRRSIAAPGAISHAAGGRPLPSGDAAVAPLPVPVRRRGPLGSPLPEENAAIPLDRVPYFRSDLRRIAITGGLMFAILIGGSFFIR